MDRVLLPEVCMKRTIIRVLTLALVLLVVGCGSSGSDAKKDSPVAKDKDSSSEVFESLKATRLGEAFRLNEKGADARNKGKILVVEGEVYTLQPSDGKVRVALKADMVPSFDSVTYTVECLFDGAEKEKVVTLTPHPVHQGEGKIPGL
jgi:hypothetical protein